MKKFILIHFLNFQLLYLKFLELNNHSLLHNKNYYKEELHNAYVNEIYL